MCEPVFMAAGSEDVPFLEKISAENPKLTELYTSLKILSPMPYIGSIWCGKVNGEIKEVIYENGCYTMLYNENGTYIYRDDGDVFNTDISLKHRLCFMEYKGKSPTEMTDVTKLDNRGFREIYKLARGVQVLPETTEKRCLYSMLCFNKGLSRGFALLDGENMLSTASVVSVNEKYALIGNVFTKQEQRGRGLATKAVLSAVKYITDRNLIPVLICEKELKEFYEKIGFSEE